LTKQEADFERSKFIEMAEQNTLKRNVLSAQIDLSKFNFDDSSFEKATDEEKKQQDVMSESTTFFKDGMKKLMKNPLAVGSIIVLIFIMSVIIVAPHIVPYSYSQIISVNGKRDKTAKNLKPFEYSENELEYIAEGGEVFPHIMGTDAQCRDYFIRVVYGTRVSLAVGLFASILVLIIGLLYGSISGYMGGKVDLIMQRIVDIIYSLPDMLVIILLSVVLNETLTAKLEGTPLQSLGVNMISLFIVYGLLYWVSMSRLVRGQILTIKNNEYVLAAKATGAKSGRIIAKHIIPNCISVIIISTALQIPSAIFTESYLSFIGLGVQAPMPSLGSLANTAREGLQSYPYKLVFPAVVICLIVLSLNLLGDGLRDAFDPKLKK
jgi:ABC-type dipeptide/oligopeptide/nickel transport systems, permease components